MNNYKDFSYCELYSLITRCYIRVCDMKHLSKFETESKIFAIKSNPVQLNKLERNSWFIITRIFERMKDECRILIINSYPVDMPFKPQLFLKRF
jgi:hypothetical protein